MYESGKSYLIVLPFGWVVVGKCVEPVGLMAYKFSNCSYIVSTGGTPWGDLAAGKGRKEAKTQQFGIGGEAMIGTQILWAAPWAGKVPGE